MINKVSNYEYYKPTFGAKPMPKDVALRLKQRLLSANGINIIPHSSPDEDAINSSKVIYNWLIKNKKQTSICVDKNEVRGLFFNRSEYKIGNLKILNPLSLILDFNAKAKTPKKQLEIFAKLQANSIIGIDHHLKTTDTINGDFYIDDTAKSNCAVIFRFFEAIEEKLTKKDIKSLYCGILSDFQKFKLIKFENSQNKFRLVKTDKLFQDKNSLDIFENIESKLNLKDKQQIQKNLNVLLKLNSHEKLLQKFIFENIKVTPNKKLAYVIIEPENKLWKNIYYDNTRSSAILRDVRSRLMNGITKDPDLTDIQKEELKDIKGVIEFYRVSASLDSPFQMSMSTKNDYAIQLIEHIKSSINPDLMAGGHANRAGGRIHSIKKEDVEKFINDFIRASEEID